MRVGTRPSAAGLALLELLVALAVVGLVLAGLSQGTHFGLVALRGESRLASRSEGFEIVDRTVRRLVEAMDPGDELNPAPFFGASDGLECITSMPESVAGPARRMRASLFVDRAHRLVLRWQPFMRAILLRPLPAPAETELLSHVSRIELAFWRPQTGWVSAWRSPDLPELVRIRLRFPDGDARHWPDIVAAPLLDRQ